MSNLCNMGRVFFGTAIAGMGVVGIYYKQVPYMLLPPWQFNTLFALAVGAVLVLMGVCIVFKIAVRPVSLLSGGLLLLVFCLCFIPYQLLVSTNNTHLGDWENAAKELDLAAGAFLVAGCFPAEDKNAITRFLAKLVPAGAILFAIPIISYGILHFQVAEQASTLVPAWIPYKLFWVYLAGAGLFASGVAIVLRIKVRLAATLLGSIILIWFVILHIPRVVVAAPADMDGETTSAFLALAYSGIAFIIAGRAG